MIRLQRLNGDEVVVNAELIETVEPHPQDTTLHLVTGNRVIVKNTEEEIVEKVLEYRRKIAVDGASSAENLMKHFVKK